MILTDKFVYVHLPKTGGTFVTEMIEQLDKKTNKYRPMPYLPKKVQRKLRKDFVDKNKHGTCREIPLTHQDKPILSTIRNPYDRYVSQYEFGWWKKYPPGDVNEILSKYPHFPDLSFEEYWHLLNEVVLPQKIKDISWNGEPNFGYQTWQFVEFYFKEPQKILPIIDEQYLSAQKYKTDMYPVHFIKTGRLNQDLYNFLVGVGYKKNEVEFVLASNKICPPGGGRDESQSWDKYYTPELKSRTRKKENFIFALFPAFDG